MLSVLKHCAWKSVLPSCRITQLYFCAEASNIAMIHKAPGSQQVSASPADGARRVKVPCFELLHPICPLTRGRTASLSYKGKWNYLFLTGKISFFVSGPSSFPHLVVISSGLLAGIGGEVALGLCCASPPSSKSGKKWLTLLHLSLA